METRRFPLHLWPAATVVVLLLLVTPIVLAKTSIRSDSSSSIIQFRDAEFSAWKHDNVTYLSSSGYNAMGMAPLYRIANQIIGLFVGEAVLPEGKILNKRCILKIITNC